jgi:hypothetical protein
MTSIRTIVISMLGVAFSASLLYAQDLSTYREFQLGTSLPAVAKQVRMKPAEAKTTHQRPALIQELEWQALYLDPKAVGQFRAEPLVQLLQRRAFSPGGHLRPGSH